MDLASPPPPLTPRQRAVFWIVATICAATRFVTMARTLWDWDETLFLLGMQEYDVTMHHPHPPGFPLFIGMAKVLRLAIDSDFRSLQAISLAAGMLAFPAMFVFARELRLRYEVALIGGALFAFFPNVWFFGGSAFSDVPSIVLVVFAATFLLRGARDRKSYFFGTFLLAIAIGIRPQNLLVGLWPGFVATRRRMQDRQWLDITAALLIGIIIVGAAYGAAAYATGGWDRYVSAIRAHGDYIRNIDSWRAPERPPLWRLFDRFFIKQYQNPPLSIVVSLFVLISTIGAIRQRDRSIGWTALTFAPVAIMAWLMLDRFSISRFSIGYAPMFAILAADGIARVSRGRRDLEAALGLVLVSAFAAWAGPAFEPVRNEISPPVRAMEAIGKHFDPRKHELFVAYSMTPFVEYAHPHIPFHRVLDDRAMPLSIGTKEPWLLTELNETKPAGMFFSRERGSLWNIARRHYFEIVYKPVVDRPQFVSGWYPPERNNIDEWRWMGARSVTRLPPMSGLTKLHMFITVPVETLPQRPKITVTLNGAVVDTFEATQEHTWREREYTPAPNGAPNTLELSIDRTLREQSGENRRELGMLIRYLSWGPT